jgi:deoxyadenosine/deoxycytidine kinase
MAHHVPVNSIAIAGMVGSGKTELVKDILYQISTQTKNELTNIDKKK